MPAYVGASFLPAFYAPGLDRPTPSVLPSSPSPAAPLPTTSLLKGLADAQPVFFNDPSHRSKTLSEMMALKGFPDCQQQFTALLDRLADFVDASAGQVQPPLDDEKKRSIKDRIDTLKDHLTNEKEDYFDSQKSLIYGSAKELFHKLDDLLANSQLPLQRRMQAVQALAPSLGTCAGGVATAVRNAVSELHINVAGVKGAVHRVKLQMMQALILEHVRTHHKNIRRGNEVHYVNAYFNHIAAEMGVPEQEDPFIERVRDDIKEPQWNACKTAVFARLKPGALATVLADTYIDRIKVAVSSADICAESVFEGATLSKAYHTINDVKMTMLKEFGEVPTDKFLMPADDTLLRFAIARHSTAVARHFMDALKENKLVDFNDAIALPLNDGRGKLVVLDNLMWRDNDGQCTPVAAADLLQIAPGDVAHAMGAETGRTSQERDLVLKSMIMEVLYTGERSASADAWMSQCAVLLTQIGPEDEVWAMPVLHMAAMQDELDVVKKMVDAGIDVNMRDANGWTAAMSAAGIGHIRTLEVLVKADPTTVSLQNDAGLTAVTLAAGRGHVGALQVLIEAKPDIVDLIDNRGCTAAMTAAGLDRIDVLNTLIGAGADLSIQDRAGFVALMHAAMKGRVEPLKALISAKLETVNAKDNKGQTAAMLAAGNGHAEALKILIGNQPATLNVKDTEGRTAAMHAAVKGHVGALEILIEAGADLSIKDRHNLTAAMHAVRQGHHAVVARLEQAGANIDTQNGRGFSARGLLALFSPKRQK